MKTFIVNIEKNYNALLTNTLVYNNRSYNYDVRKNRNIYTSCNKTDGVAKQSRGVYNMMLENCCIFTINFI